MKTKNYEISEHARLDLTAIAEYTYLNFGITQAENYRDSLIRCFEMLGDNKLAGTEVSHIAEGIRRHAHNEHIIYYEPGHVILILRILGKRQDPLRQHFNTLRL